MSLEQTNKIDAMGLDKKSGHLVLTIADAWDWENENQHLIALQEKLNAYLDFIESGQIFENIDSGTDKVLRIHVVFRYPPPPLALEFLEKAEAVTSQVQVLVTSEFFP